MIQMLTTYYPLKTGYNRKAMSEIKELSRWARGRFPRPNPDLRPNSPSFVHETSFAYGTPSGEVLFRRPSRYEHVGEPAQDSHSLFNTHFQARDKEIDDLRKQISSIQSSLSTIVSRLDSQSIGPESLRVSRLFVVRVYPLISNRERPWLMISTT